MPGKYKALYQYLDNRYANTVDLTFAQIEDHLGFTLPDSARVDHRVVGEQRPERHPTASFAIVDIGQQASHAESAGQTAVFERAHK